MGAFQSAFNDSLEKAIDYFKNWNAEETEKTKQILGNFISFLGEFSKDFQQDLGDFIYKVSKLIPELINVEIGLARATFKEIGEVVKDSANIINAEENGFSKIFSAIRDVQLAIINALNVTISKALDKVLTVEKNLFDYLNKIADKVNVHPLIVSVQKINPDLNKALTFGIDSAQSGILRPPGPIILPKRQSVFTGVVIAAGYSSVILSFINDLVNTGLYSFFTFKTKGILPIPLAHEEQISFTVESRYKVHENLVPFQKFINGTASAGKYQGLKIVKVEVVDESPEIDAYLQHQSTFNDILQSK